MSCLRNTSEYHRSLHFTPRMVDAITLTINLTMTYAFYTDQQNLGTVHVSCVEANLYSRME